MTLGVRYLGLKSWVFKFVLQSFVKRRGPLLGSFLLRSSTPRARNYAHYSKPYSFLLFITTTEFSSDVDCIPNDTNNRRSRVSLTFADQTI